MKKLLLAALLTLTLCFGLGGGMAFAADPTDAAQIEVCEGISGQVGGSCDSDSGIGDIMKVILVVISIIAGFAAVIMIMIGGVKYITSGGDSSSISSAKSTLIYALIGVIVVALAQFIVKYVLGQSESVLP